MKNIIFIVNIDNDNNRNKPYHYSIKSWKKWADKNNAEVFVLTERVYENNYMHTNWHKSLALELLKSNNIEYNQVLIVDADTIVHPNCPNFFNETDDKFCAVMNDSCYEWVQRSIRKYGDYIFPDIEKIKTWEYFNSGFIIVNKKHEDFFDKVLNFYHDNFEKFAYSQSFLVGHDQTPLNFFVKKYNIETKLLPNCYNFQDMFKKNLLHIPGHSWWADELIFLDSGWVYHFNSIPKNNRHVSYWMERTYKKLYKHE
jgi:hypothetical protein